MKYNILFIVILSFSAAYSQASTTTISQNKTNASDSTKKITKNIEVSFYSVCCGTNDKAIQEFSRIMKDYPMVKDYVYYEGKEGEVNHCLTLTNLSTNERKSLLKKLKQLAGTMELVRVTKNVSCVHKK